jgi:hypothetical protein
MDERTLRILLHSEIFLARATSNEVRKGHRKMRAGEICSSCKALMPEPHTPGRKRCANCAQKHHVHMVFYFFGGWRCRFATERWQPLQKRVTFRDSASIWEAARRGNALIDDAAREGLELDLEFGRGGILLRLTDEQFRALGGAL